MSEIANEALRLLNKRFGTNRTHAEIDAWRNYLMENLPPEYFELDYQQPDAGDRASDADYEGQAK